MPEIRGSAGENYLSTDIRIRPMPRSVLMRLCETFNTTWERTFGCDWCGKWSWRNGAKNNSTSEMKKEKKSKMGIERIMRTDNARNVCYGVPVFLWGFYISALTTTLTQLISSANDRWCTTKWRPHLVLPKGHAQHADCARLGVGLWRSPDINRDQQRPTEISTETNPDINRDQQRPAEVNRDQQTYQQRPTQISTGTNRDQQRSTEINRHINIYQQRYQAFPPDWMTRKNSWTRLCPHLERKNININKNYKWNKVTLKASHGQSDANFIRGQKTTAAAHLATSC